MKFSVPTIATLVAAASAIPYTPPTDQPDGVYSVSFDGAGQPVTRRLADPDVTAPELQTRDLPGAPVCTGRDIPQDGTYRHVQDCLGNWLNSYSGQFNTLEVGGDSLGQILYCHYGDSLLALCTYNSDPSFSKAKVYGSYDEINQFNVQMDNTCGAWKSGYIFIKDWNKTYWRTTWGEEVCGNIGDEYAKQVY